MPSVDPSLSNESRLWSAMVDRLGVGNLVESSVVLEKLELMDNSPVVAVTITEHQRGVGRAEGEAR